MATRIKHYEAELKDLDHLLQIIESEMGPDAQLETVEYVKGGVMGLGGRKMISITATIEVHPATIGSTLRRTIKLEDDWTRPKPRESGPAAAKRAELSEPPSRLVDLSQRRSSIPMGSDIKAEVRGRTARPVQPPPRPKAEPEVSAAAVEGATVLTETSPPPARQAKHSAHPPTPVQASYDEEILSAEAAASFELAEDQPGVGEAPPEYDGGQDLTAPLAQLRDAERTSAPAAQTSAAQREAYDELIDWNVRSADALKLIEHALTHYAPGAQPTTRGLLGLVATGMLSRLHYAPGLAAAKGQRRSVAMIGPTGSGKTSLIGKLAATYAFEHGLSVALISLDTYRIGAVDQLRAFAGIMGFPLSVAFTAEEFASQLAESEADLTLIDTAGRSPLNQRQLDELQSDFAARQPDEVHLALPATARYDDLGLLLEAFTPLGFDKLIVTKLDETRSPAMLYNLSQLSAKPLSFFSTGQSIPEDLREASASVVQSWASGAGLV